MLITEIGGTVGDMEGLLFIEALRQFALEVGKENVCFIHVTLLPYITAAGEAKTKPTQQSVAKLRELGIQPDIIICRTETDLDEDNRKKIAMFCNVERKNVVAFRDVAHTIYECPLDLRRDKIDRLVVDKIGLGHTPSPALGGLGEIRPTRHPSEAQGHHRRRRANTSNCRTRTNRFTNP